MRHLQRTGSVLMATALLAACGGSADAPVATPAPTAVPSPTQTNTRMDDLRQLAQQAAHAQRLFAPAGDNALEYYLRLRQQQANDPSTQAALVDLQPLLVIAAEQAIANGRYPESRRLQTLLAQVDPQAPALTRLQAAVDSAEAVVRERELAVDAETKAKALKAEADLRQKAHENAARLSVERAAASPSAVPVAATPVSKAAAPASAPAAERPQPAAITVTPSTPAPMPATAALSVTANSPAATPARSAAVPKPIRQPPPRYPTSAGRNGVSGQVQVAFTITAAGDVESARVVASNLPASFDRAAVFAVSRWKFEATGSSVATTTSVKFDSQLP